MVFYSGNCNNSDGIDDTSRCLRWSKWHSLIKRTRNPSDINLWIFSMNLSNCYDISCFSSYAVTTTADSPLTMATFPLANNEVRHLLTTSAKTNIFSLPVSRFISLLCSMVLVQISTCVLSISTLACWSCHVLRRDTGRHLCTQDRYMYM